MYAVIETGGKQYRVQPGDFIEIEKLTGEVGSDVSFQQVLFFSQQQGDSSQIQIGKPYLPSAKVEGQIVGQGRGEKTLIIKIKRRKAYRKTQGHRQELTHVLITKVDNGEGWSNSCSEEEKKTKLQKFRSYLKPKGVK